MSIGSPGWTTARVVGGPPAAALLSAPTDLVVLGLADGATRLPGVARPVLHGATVPVVVVPQPWRRSDGPVEVGLCGTAASMSALRWAAAEARRRRVDLMALHAWQPASARVPRRTSISVERSRVHERAQSWVSEALGDQQVALLIPHGPRLEALLEGACGAGLLVLGSGTHPAWERVLHGRVGDDVVPLAGCPVAAVPDPLTAQRHRSAHAPGQGTN